MRAPVERPAYWSGRYASGDAPWDLGQPAPALAEWISKHADEIHGQCVIVPGCGTGHDAEAFARAGIHVTAVDFASSALADLRKRAGSLSTLETVAADVFDLPENARGPYDGWVEHTCYPAIDPRRRAAYWRTAHAQIKPGGWLLGLFFPLVTHLKPKDSPPWPMTHHEIERYSRGFFDIETIDNNPASEPSRQGFQALYLLRRKP